LPKEIPRERAFHVDVPLNHVGSWKIERKAIHIRNAATGQVQRVYGKPLLEQEGRVGLIACESRTGDEGRVVWKTALDAEVFIAPVKNAKSAANHGLAGRLPRQAQPGREVVSVRARERARKPARPSLRDRD